MKWPSLSHNQLIIKKTAHSQWYAVMVWCMCLGLLQTPLYAQKKKPLSLSFSHEAGYHQDAISLELKASDEGSVIYYTLDGSIPSAKSNKYKAPLKIKETAVVRAFAIRNNRATEVDTRTFLINEQSPLGVLSVSIPPHFLFHEETGLFQRGPNARETFPFYGANFWSRRELPCNIEFFEPQQKRKLSEKVGFMLFGGNSRIFPQKSFSLAARKKYGKKSIKHPFFQSRQLTKYKHLVVRNGGSDFNSTHLRDAVMTHWGSKFGLPVQAYRPIIVFLNGRYWGMYDLREKMNRYFIQNNLGEDKDSLDLIEHRQDVKFGSIKSYNALRAFLWEKKTNLNNVKDFERTDREMDWHNFITYQMFQIYVDNQDAGGNIKFWKPWRKDGKWSWLLYDTDFGLGMAEKDAYNNNSLAFHTDPEGPIWPNPPWTTLNLRKLLENDKVRHLFINRFADGMNTTFRPEAALTDIDSFTQQIAPELERHLKRWKMTLPYWRNQLERMKTFVKERPKYMRQHLDERFNLGTDVTVSVLGAAKLNEFLQVKAGFRGTYFQNIPFYIEATPPFGYRFTHWEIDGQRNTSPKLTLSLKDGRERRIQPFYQKIDCPFQNQVLISEASPFPTPWFEVWNAQADDLNTKDWLVLVDGNVRAKLSKASLNKRAYLIVAHDTAAFKKSHPAFRGALLQINLNIWPKTIALTAPDSGAICQAKWPVEALEEKSFALQNPYKADSWVKEKPSPGRSGWTFRNHNRKDALQYAFLFFMLLTIIGIGIHQKIVSSRPQNGGLTRQASEEEENQQPSETEP